MDKRFEEFLRDLKSIATCDIDVCDFGRAGCSFSGSLRFHGDIREVMEHHPKMTRRHLRTGCMIVLKRLMREERERLYSERASGPGLLCRLLRLVGEKTGLRRRGV